MGVSIGVRSRLRAHFPSSCTYAPNELVTICCRLHATRYVMDALYVVLGNKRTPQEAVQGWLSCDKTAAALHQRRPGYLAQRLVVVLCLPVPCASMHSWSEGAA